MHNREGTIPLDECVDRGLYRIHSRNLETGVFVAERKGFIGIREKFGSRFLDTEYHFGTGAPHGTASPLEFLEKALPTEIPLKEYLGSVDQVTGKAVLFDKPVRDGGKGWYFVDTGEASEEIRPVAVSNEPLFEWIEKESA